MNKIFDIKRFGKYFKYDLINARNTFGTSMLVCGLVPVIVFLATLFFMLTGVSEISSATEVSRFVGMIAALVVVVINFPIKVYGPLTDKKAGSSWLMIPASTAEKFASILIMTCVVVPACLFVLLMASDTVLGLIFPGVYGAPFIKSGSDFLKNIGEVLSESGLNFNLGWAGYLSWCGDILVFTLGAIFFKKSKAAKTILFIMLFGMVVSSMMTAAFGSANLDLMMERAEINPANFIKGLNVIINIIYIIEFALFDFGIYYRIRTLKH